MLRRLAPLVALTLMAAYASGSGLSARGSIPGLQHGLLVQHGCYEIYSGAGGQEDSFSISNYRTAPIRRVKIDIYLGSRVKVLQNPRYDNSLTAVFKIVGGHAWTTVPLIQGRSGIQWQPILKIHASAAAPWKSRVVVTVGGKPYTWHFHCP